MKIDIFDASEWLYPDETRAGAPAARLNVARGAYAGFQVRVTGAASGAKTEFSTVSGGMLRVEVYRLIEVSVPENTNHGEQPKDITRVAPYRVYDALRPWDDSDAIGENGEACYYICVYAPCEAVPGTYTCAITLNAGGCAITIEAAVRVYAALLAQKETLQITNWFNINNMAKLHGIAPWSEAHWDMIARYGLLMRRWRQTTFWVTGETYTASFAPDGSYTFDFSRAKRLIEMYLGMGFTHIEGSSVCHRTIWTDPRFFVTDPAGKKMWASDEDGYAYVVAFLKAWRAFLEENGWYSLLIQHVSDEPQTYSREDYYKLASVVRQQLPGVPIIEATDIHDLPGALDIWVFKPSYYDTHKESFEAMRATGNTLWFYTCCFPLGNYLNRFLDKRLCEPRLLHWANYVYNMRGYLHWGLNMIQKDQNPFGSDLVLDSSIATRLPPGDTHIVYPGEGMPWGSMRGENMMFGAQDFELLALLEKKDAALAAKIARSVVRAFDDFEKEPAKIEEARTRLLEALSV